MLTVAAHDVDDAWLAEWLRARRLRLTIPTASSLLRPYFHRRGAQMATIRQRKPEVWEVRVFLARPPEVRPRGAHLASGCTRGFGSG
jgi:hypothetical protein